MTTAAPLSRQLHLNSKILFVDGITRTGKSMMGPILASFHRVEIERMEEIIEHVGTLYRMGKITKDAAVGLLRMQTDMHLYNSLIGRNTNFRFGDHSSVWQNPNRLRYVKRIFGPESAAAIEWIVDGGVIYQNQTHDQLANFWLYYQAFSERLRIIEMVRHPVDLVDSWLRRDWGGRYGADPLAFTLCIRHEGQEVPYYAVGWEDKYLASTPLSRVIRMIGGLWDDNRQTYASLTQQQKDQVFIISFERFVQDPLPYLQPIADFLGSRTTRHTLPALKRQRCPRTYSLEARLEKQNRIEKEAPPEERKMLERMICEYEMEFSSPVLPHDRSQ